MNNLVTYKSQSAIINLPHNKYIDRVLRSNSFEELWWRFKDAESPSKEISESYAAFSNMKKICKVSNYTWLHIGDGAYTRTAAIFAFFSKSRNHSIDPAINLDKFYEWNEEHNVNFIYVNKCKFEDFEMSLLSGKTYNICCVHAHVNLEEVNRKFPEWKYLYSNICCYPQKQTFSDQYMKENEIAKIVHKLDLGIFSERREIAIYKNCKNINK